MQKTIWMLAVVLVLAVARASAAPLEVFQGSTTLNLTSEGNQETSYWSGIWSMGAGGAMNTLKIGGPTNIVQSGGGPSGFDDVVFESGLTAMSFDSSGNFTMLEVSGNRAQFRQHGDIIRFAGSVDLGNVNGTVTCYVDRCVYVRNISTTVAGDNLRPFLPSLAGIHSDSLDNHTLVNTQNSFFNSSKNGESKLNAGWNSSYGFMLNSVADVTTNLLYFQLNTSLDNKNYTASRTLAANTSTFRYGFFNDSVSNIAALESIYLSWFVDDDYNNLTAIKRYDSVKNPPLPTMIAGSLNTTDPFDKDGDGFNAFEGLYVFNANANLTTINFSNPRTVFKPIFKIYSYQNDSFPIVELINASGRHKMQNGTDYTVYFKNNDATTDTLIFQLYHNINVTTTINISGKAGPAPPANLGPTLGNQTESPTDPATYEPSGLYAFNTGTWDSDGVSAALIEISGTNYTAISIDTDRTWQRAFTGLAAGLYNYLWHANDTLNVWNLSESFTYTINRATGAVNISKSPVANTTYGIPITYGCSANTSQALPSLERNGTVTGNQSGITLAAGSYNLTCYLAQSQNYTAAVQYLNFEIAKATGIVNLTINNQRSNISVVNGTIVNLTAVRQAGDTATIIELFRNGVLLNNATWPVSNLSNETVVSPPLVNITACQLESQNYTRDCETWFINITPRLPNATLTQLRLNGTRANLSSTVGYIVNYNATRLNCTENQTVQVYRNGSLLGSGTNSFAINSTENTVGLFNITGVSLSSDNCARSEETWWLTVTAAASGSESRDTAGAIALLFVLVLSIFTYYAFNYDQIFGGDPSEEKAWR